MTIDSELLAEFREAGSPAGTDSGEESKRIIEPEQKRRRIG
ncbi:hypothetical protein OOT46_26810 [Aquabacterium sp. A7-Y]|nr:hypothetical protein [Aquabacterium sp. A7-Y]MCW7541425.1 hypothetical protein [Aquabacterium sp. A7-Y]